MTSREWVFVFFGMAATVAFGFITILVLGLIELARRHFDDDPASPVADKIEPRREWKIDDADDNFGGYR